MPESAGATAVHSTLRHCQLTMGKPVQLHDYLTYWCLLGDLVLFCTWHGQHHGPWFGASAWVVGLVHPPQPVPCLLATAAHGTRAICNSTCVLLRFAQVPNHCKLAASTLHIAPVTIAHSTSECILYRVEGWGEKICGCKRTLSINGPWKRWDCAGITQCW